MSKILIITHDLIAEQMAGPAIRSYEMARTLSTEHTVVLGSTSPPQVTAAEFNLVQITENSLQGLCLWADVLIIQPTILYLFPLLREIKNPLVVDLYNLFLIEGLEANKNLQSDEKIACYDLNITIAIELLQRGDYFICSNERQKDFWLGLLYGQKIINPAYYELDSTAHRMLGIVPNGISSEPPVHTRSVLKGIDGVFKPKDKLIIWGGSACNWFDPLTLVEAIAILKRQRSDIKAFFMGSQVPGADIPDYIWSEYVKATQCSRELGLYGTDILFNPDWIPYKERENYLLEANLGLSLHFDTLETRYSYRSRILDYLWAQIPVITNPGDYMADIVQEHNLGRVVPIKNPQKLAATINELLNNRMNYLTCQENIRAILPKFTWKTVMKPLLSYCRHPWKQNS